jgi:hypothetical protein
MEDLGIVKGGGMRLDITDEGLNQILGFAAPSPHEYPVPPMDMAEYFFF